MLVFLLSQDTTLQQSQLKMPDAFSSVTNLFATHFDETTAQCNEAPQKAARLAASLHELLKTEARRKALSLYWGQTVLPASTIIRLPTSGATRCAQACKVSARRALSESHTVHTHLLHSEADLLGSSLQEVGVHSMRFG